MKRTDYTDAPYTKLSVASSTTVSELVALWAGARIPPVDASIVTLRLVRRGPGKPGPDEEEQALKPEALLDDPRLTLQEAGLVDDCSLLASFARKRAGAC